MTTPTPAATTNPSSDEAPGSPTTTVTRRSQWTGLEPEILEKVVRPKMMAAIAALNASGGVSTTSVSRYFHDVYKVPASTNTIAAWFKGLGIKVSTRAYVELPPTNPTQSVLDRQLNDLLARQRQAQDAANSPIPLADGRLVPEDLTPMTFSGATPLAGTQPDPSYGFSLDPTPPPNAQ